MSMPGGETSWVPLNYRERRVVGVLVEKQKTTPDNYPMSIAAVVTGCNQKSNRDPLTNFDADDVEEILNNLRHKGAAVMVEGGGRVVKWKHTLYDWLGLRGRAAEMAVLAELLLRGPQTEGELRQRASRMDEIADLNVLQTILSYLNELGLVVFLTPPGQRRGVVVTHGLYPPEELERVRQTQAARNVEEADPRPARPAEPSTPGQAEELAALRVEVEQLRHTVETVQADLQALKQTLGA